MVVVTGLSVVVDVLGWPGVITVVVLWISDFVVISSMMTISSELVVFVLLVLLKCFDCILSIVSNISSIISSIFIVFLVLLVILVVLL